MIAVLVMSVALASPIGAYGQSPDRVTALLRLPFPAEDGSLTPYTFNVGYPLVTLIYDTLMWRDEHGVPQPWLARSLDRSPDGLQYTVHLAEGVRWHDGASLTAADVAFTFNFAATHPHPRFTPQLAAVTRVVAPDAATVVMTLSQPSPGFVDQPLADLPILPAHLWQGRSPERPIPDGLAVGSGPFRLIEHRSSETYRFEANAGYFRGRPAVTALEVPIIPSEDETLKAFERRHMDMLPVNLSQSAAEQVAGPGTAFAQGPSYLGTALMFNLRRPPFDRVEVRQALSKALDLAAISRGVGQATPAAGGFVHPASPWSDERPLHLFDEAASRHAVAQLRLSPIEVLTADNDTIRLEAGRQVVQALREVGASADLREVTRAELSQAVGEDGSTPSFQTAIWSVPPLASYEPDFLSRQFGSTPNASLNYSGYRSPAFDSLAQRVATTMDTGARRSLVRDELQLLANDVPAVPLFFADGRFAYRPASYDQWVFIKGTGILDKRSFVEPRPTSGAASPLEGDSGEWLRGALSAVAVALITAFVGRAALRFVRRGHERDRNLES
jgi:peptide/nickel transport system substrate-binding protein